MPTLTWAGHPRFGHGVVLLEYIGVSERLRSCVWHTYPIVTPSTRLFYRIIRSIEGGCSGFWNQRQQWAPVRPLPVPVPDANTVRKTCFFLITAVIEEGACCLVVEALEFLCSEKRHEILVETPSIFRVLSPNRAWFLCFQTMSQRMAPSNKKSSFWPKHWLTIKGGDKRKLVKSNVDLNAN